MIQKLYTAFIAVFVLAIIACSDNVAGSSEDPNTVTAKNNLSSSSDVEISSSAMVESSSSIKTLSSSSEKVVLCKVSGGWGGCAKFGTGGIGDLWPYTGSKNVHTNAYAEDSSQFGEHAGELYFETDSIEGGKTEVLWYEGNWTPERNYFGNGFLFANVRFDKGNLSRDPYFELGFYVAGFDKNGVLLSADISNWNGLCFLFHGSIVPTLQLDLGDSLNQKLGFALPAVAMVSSEEPQCYNWSQFKQPDIDKKHDIISGEDAAKHVAKVVFRFQARSDEKFDDYEVFEFIAIGTNRDE